MTFQNLSLKHSNFFVLADVPFSNAVIVAAGQDDLIALSESDCSDRSVVATKRFQKLTTFGVPQANGVVLAAADDARSILRERDSSNRSFVTVKTAELRRRNHTSILRCQPREVVRSNIARPPDQDAFVVATGDNRVAVR